MIKCKEDMGELPECGKDICCFVCEKKATCEGVCMTALYLKDVKKCDSSVEEEDASAENTAVQAFENKSTATASAF